MTTEQTASKIVIVAGQEFSVPAETDNEAIRQQLAGMGFADVASATIQKGKRTVDGAEVETIEFVKKAGTKGLSGGDLAELLGQLPPAAPPHLIIYGPTAAQAALLTQLDGDELTFDQVLAAKDELVGALEACYSEPSHPRQEGAVLCTTIDHLDPVAAAASCGW